MTRLAIALMVSAAFAGSSAQAQSYGQQQQLYPYAVQSQQPYAVEVAPNTYVIHRPPVARSYPYVTCVNCSRNASDEPRERSAPASDRPHPPADRALIEELRKGQQAKPTVITSKKTVREKPIVKETVRVVNDPPRVIERRHVVEDATASTGESPDAGSKAAPPGGKTRVIQADAEITILGPDRMSIRLFRKRPGPEAKAQPGD